MLSYVSCTQNQLQKQLTALNGEKLNLFVKVSRSSTNNIKDVYRQLVCNLNTKTRITWRAHNLHQGSGFCKIHATAVVKIPGSKKTWPGSAPKLNGLLQARHPTSQRSFTRTRQLLESSAAVPQWWKFLTHIVIQITTKRLVGWLVHV